MQNLHWRLSVGIPKPSRTLQNNMISLISWASWPWLFQHLCITYRHTSFAFLAHRPSVVVDLKAKPVEIQVFPHPTGYEVNVSYSVTYVSRSTIFECCVVRFGSSNGYQKDMWFKRIGVRAHKFVKCSRVNNFHNWGPWWLFMIPITSTLKIHSISMRD